MSGVDDLLEALVPGSGGSGERALHDPDFPTDLGLRPLGVVGRGGVGVVYKAHDPVLQRDVAVKIARADGGARARKALLAEAQRTCLLNHPAVLRVHRVVVSGGRLCVVCDLAPSRTLLDTLAEVVEGADEPAMAQRLGILLRVAEALQRAHEVGVVHGDLHPGNIALSEHGDPFVLDWAGALDTEGTVTGHLGYAAPEVLTGQAPTAASDVWSFGALSWEMLTLRPLRPRRYSDTAQSFVARWTGAPEPRLSDAVQPDPAMRRLVHQMLANDPVVRGTSEQIVQVIRSVITGQQERRRKARRAQVLLAHGRECLEQVRELGESEEEERRALIVQRAKVAGHAPLSEKRPLWDAEDRVQALVDGQRRAWWEALEAVGQAWLLAPDPRAARETLSELWWHSLREAWQGGDAFSANLAQERVEMFDEGHYHQLLAASSHVTLRVQGALAGTVSVYRFVEVDRLLQLDLVDELPLPLKKLPLPAGSYLLIVRCEGRRDLRYPLSLARLQHHRGVVHPYTSEQIGDGWLHIPAGSFRLGGGSKARQPLDPCVPFIGDRFVMRTMVTSQEWKEFLDDLGPALAREHVPGEKGLFGAFQPAWVERDGRWEPPAGWDLQWPICAIHMGDMLAYAAWRSLREGRTVRLLTEEEWEKSARGVDGRSFPWGDHFDPLWCHMHRSVPGAPSPVPVASYPVDESVYGCMDTGGLMRELTASSFDSGQYVVRGGNFGDDVDDCRCACRAGIQPRFRSSFVSFRLCAEHPVGSGAT